jgi:hypothetical protein
MPARVERDLDHAIDVDFPFQVVEQSIDAQRVPIVESGRFASTVSCSEEPAVPNVN